jgi:hypothetical protein
MASIAFDPAAQPTTDTPGRHPAWAGFRRLLNLRNIAITFYFCLLMVLSRYVGALYGAELGAWSLDVVRFLRQTLISGLLVLFAVAAAHGVAHGWRLSQRQSIALAIAAAGMAAAIAVVLRYWVYGSPLAEITRAWGYSLSLAVAWAAIGGLGYAIFTLLDESRAQRHRILDAECRGNLLQAQRVEAHLSALQAQIEPHFLFNTLANVKRLYDTAPGRGREMLAALIAYLRAALPTMRETGSTLGRELDLVRSYLTILQMRMGERLGFSIDAPAALRDAPMPPMILPTLVENAIKHGIGPLPAGGRIELRAVRDGDAMQVEVHDSGAGFQGASGTGVGLANTRARLAALYGTGAGLQLCARPGGGVAAVLRIPLTRTGPAT